MKMTAVEVIEKWRQNLGWCMTEEETREMGGEEFRHLLSLALDIPEYRLQLIDWFMKKYEPYFKEVLNG